MRKQVRYAHGRVSLSGQGFDVLTRCNKALCFDHVGAIDHSPLEKIRLNDVSSLEWHQKLDYAAGFREIVQ